MKHPSEATLALHAGGDLGFFARWRTARHLARCERCQNEAAAFSELRELSAGLNELPGVPWNRLAAEMKANIRLGLAAGECVRDTRAMPQTRPLFAGARAAVAFASVVALAVTGLMLEHPSPRPAVAQQEGVVVQATLNGIQVKDGGESLSLLHVGRSRDVTFSVGAEGSMRARYVDPDTGSVTINNVYAQ
jgi:anti-sigma factor RsiW